jgi:arylsulfatase A-like enzyme
VRSIDVAPTLLQLVGVPPHEAMDGISLANFLNKAAGCPELDAFNETGIWISDVPGLPDNHLRYPNLFELLEVPDPESGTLAIKTQYENITLRARDRMIRRGRWKLVYQPLSDGYLLSLFDVDNDPECQRDIKGEHPEIIADLWSKLSQWIGPTGNA